jgi:signal recognition particle GTPase
MDKTKDAADVCRPAAIKQLQILGESIGVEVFSMGCRPRQDCCCGSRKSKG